MCEARVCEGGQVYKSATGDFGAGGSHISIDGPVDPHRLLVSHPSALDGNRTAGELGKVALWSRVCAVVRQG